MRVLVVRKEYDKFLVQSIVKNKLAVVAFIVMAFAICRQYLNGDTVVFWAFGRVCLLLLVYLKQITFMVIMVG